MSKKIITDLVLPIILKQLNLMGNPTSTYDEIKDDTILEYFEEQLVKALGVVGSFDRTDCPDLEEKIKQQLKENPSIFERGIRIMLEEYINLRIKLETSKKIKPKQVIAEMVGGSKSFSSPPSRFQNSSPFNSKNSMSFGPHSWISKKLCPKCKAPIDPKLIKCPMCGGVI